MFNIKKVLSFAAAGIIAGSSVFALSGCSQIRDLANQSEIGQKIMSSRHVDAKDRLNYIQLQDANGTNFVSVIYLQERDDTSFNTDEATAVFNEFGLNWYQMIASSSMGTSTRETCYLYFPGSYTLPDLFDIANRLSENKYEAYVLTQEQYDNYVNNVQDYDIYRNETTYFGPAAKAK